MTKLAEQKNVAAYLFRLGIRVDEDYDAYSCPVAQFLSSETSERAFVSQSFYCRRDFSTGRGHATPANVAAFVREMDRNQQPQFYAPTPRLGGKDRTC